jgi:hypothetical protein
VLCCGTREGEVEMADGSKQRKRRQERHAAGADARCTLRPCRAATSRSHAPAASRAALLVALGVWRRSGPRPGAEQPASCGSLERSEVRSQQANSSPFARVAHAVCASRPSAAWPHRCRAWTRRVSVAIKAPSHAPSPAAAGCPAPWLDSD